eukprot:TRINITY_DN5401_c0_g1_i2.p1 TRINITY_DN5401_c0_g1~~TRINITY_DN5401_c0_g1_i2.p1  ORF type:complete len:166 (+),score=16.68 TRINITY_DN5401_c0_g1_i2:65-499(+)
MCIRDRYLGPENCRHSHSRSPQSLQAHVHLLHPRRKAERPSPAAQVSNCINISNRKTDLVELLCKLREIVIFPHALPKHGGTRSELLLGEKAHLVYLMPAILECITTKEEDLREAIRHTLCDINRMVLGEYSEAKKLPDVSGGK